MPFRLRNYAYVDEMGRETVTWVREFMTSRPRRFDAYMVFGEKRGRVIDYLGSHQHLAVDIDLSVDGEGGLRLRSGMQRFHEGPISFPFPMLFSGVADVREWYDEGTEKFRIDVNVHNEIFGPLFGYRGSFEVEWRATDGRVPRDVRPRRLERRE